MTAILPISDIPIEHSGPMQLAPATLADAEAIEALIGFWADRGDMLHRPLNEVYEGIREFTVARDGETLLGCAALHIFDPGLAEIRSLAVAESTHGRGVGAQLVEACMQEAAKLGIARVFALTYRPGFFEKQQFHIADVMEFPQKVWKECVRCPFFTNCHEVAVVRDVAP